MKAKFAIGSAVLAAIVVAFVFVIGKRTQNESHHSHELAAQETAPAIEVETVQAKFLSVPERQNFTGTVASSLTADVSAKVMGKVIAVYAREGDRVQAGQVLVQLDNSDLLAQVRQAEAAVAATRAALSQAIVP
ncbi:MAG: biotin/lipoyl-binding protein [Armatimonadota bacterium]|nr:biotin/lipoyl-binding protein [Armatimonadota bacterium]